MEKAMQKEHMKPGDPKMEPWEVWHLKHRQSDIVPLVLELLRVGLRQGFYSADDIQGVSLSGSHNVRGSAIKVPVHWGIAENSGRFRKAASEESHGRIIFEYNLIRPDLARKILDGVTGLVLGEEPRVVAGELVQREFVGV
jgi:hypothetical protein